MKKIFSIFTVLLSLAFAFANTILVSAAIGTAYAMVVGSPIVMPITTILLTIGSALYKPNKNYAYAPGFTMGLCEKIQSSLIELYGSNAPSLKRSRTGFLDALVSGVNTAGFSKVPIDQGNGKIRQVRIKYIKRACVEETTTNPFDCTTDQTPEPYEQNVAITHFVRTQGLKFNASDMRLLCETGADYRAGQINAQINALMVALDRQLITLQSATFGKNPTTGLNTAKTYNMLIGPQKTPIYIGESDLMEDSENMESGQKPIVVGAGNLAAYVRQVGIGCCNDAGIDLSQAGNLNYFRDQNVESILGANHFIGMIPGYTQLLTWNENVGEFAMEDTTFSNKTIVDPVTGLMIDMNWTYDVCTKFWQVQLGLHYELYHIPDDAFKACDVLTGVNFTFHGIAANI